LDNVVILKFKGSRREFYQNYLDLPFGIGDYAVVETANGENMGLITQTKLTVDSESIKKERKILRKANSNDILIFNENEIKEKEAYQDGIEKASKLGLDMKITDIEMQLDRKKLTFYFTAKERVDFRQLVKELASKYKTRIDLRQIGPRDEAKRLDGCGVCGLSLCCSSWMSDFEPVNTQMAKEQDLPINPSRLAGVCGRLKCCLRYEHDFYTDALNYFPKVGTKFKTKDGVAEVAKIDIFSEVVYVRYPTQEWAALKLAEFDAKFSDMSVS